jgi:hypothetical protein
MLGVHLLILPLQLVTQYHKLIYKEQQVKKTLQTTLFYIFENFMQQVARAESLTSSDFGITTGGNIAAFIMSILNEAL